MQINQHFQTNNFALALALHCTGIEAPRETTFDNLDLGPCAVIHIYDEVILRSLGYEGLTLQAAARLAFEEKKRGQVEYCFQRIPVLESLLKVFDAERAITVTADSITPRIESLAASTSERSTLETAVAATVIALAIRRLVDLRDSPGVDAETFGNQLLWLDTSEQTIGQEIQSILLRRQRGQSSALDTVSRMFATITRARTLLGNLWQDFEPWIRIHHAGAAQTTTTPDGERIVKMPGFVLCPLNASAETKRRLRVA